MVPSPLKNRSRRIELLYIGVTGSHKGFTSGCMSFERYEVNPTTPNKWPKDHGPRSLVSLLLCWILGRNGNVNFEQYDVIPSKPNKRPPSQLTLIYKASVAYSKIVSRPMLRKLSRSCFKLIGSETRKMAIFPIIWKSWPPAALNNTRYWKMLVFAVGRALSSWGDQPIARISKQMSKSDPNF